ncbi:hypothetical protein [Jiulongibacter sp. NS-SX5]|uniref:hypothetical protein n=1 Tax=Jiulongibacter sp. NS-SX5 TaxID=3463854 RepID=UPI0040590983
MKTAITIFGFLLTLVSCQKQEVHVFSGSYSLEEGETITENGNAFIIKANQIQDSRCPANANCIRAGEAILSYDITINQQTFKDQSLCLMCTPEMGIPEFMVYTVNGIDQTLTLKEINPFPTTTNTSEPKTALVFLEKGTKTP